MHVGLTLKSEYLRRKQNCRHERTFKVFNATLAPVLTKKASPAHTTVAKNTASFLCRYQVSFPVDNMSSNSEHEQHLIVGVKRMRSERIGMWSGLNRDPA